MTEKIAPVPDFSEPSCRCSRLDPAGKTLHKKRMEGRFGLLLDDHPLKKFRPLWHDALGR